MMGLLNVAVKCLPCHKAGKGKHFTATFNKPIMIRLA
jgi:hypothetical protein